MTQPAPIGVRWMLASLTLLLCSACGSSPQLQTAENSPNMDFTVPEGFEQTDSGLAYRILEEGDGPKPTLQDRVTVHYRGWMNDGTEFDSSYDGPPVPFNLRGVIPGFAEGLQLVNEGGKIELFIPGEMAYANGNPAAGIPPGAPLHFELDLLSIDTKRPTVSTSTASAENTSSGNMAFDVPDNFQQTDSGLAYRILREGTGPQPTINDRVTVHYKGWMNDGRVFDSSYGGSPVPFALREVIPGFSQGLQLVKEGGKIELFIPGKMAYVDGMPAAGIPPAAPLHFELELISIN